MECINILLIEESCALRKIIATYLSQSKWLIDETPGLDDARARIAKHRPDVVIVALPCEPDVLAFLAELEQSGIDSFVATESVRARDRIACFEQGAADVMVKPLDLRELALRLKRIWRGRARGAMPVNMELACGHATLDIASRVLRRGAARPVSLTPSEFRLLYLLLRNDGRIVDRSVIARDVLGHVENNVSRSVDVMVSKLRRKLASSESGCFIRNVRSEGYVLVHDERMRVRDTDSDNSEAALERAP